VPKTIVDPANYEAAATIFGADLDGSYWTNFRMRPIQQASVITSASIGGD
jgi:hypothetical protein